MIFYYGYTDDPLSYAMLICESYPTLITGDYQNIAGPSIHNTNNRYASIYANVSYILKRDIHFRKC